MTGNSKLPRMLVLGLARQQERKRFLDKRLGAHPPACQLLTVIRFHRLRRLAREERFRALADGPSWHLIGECAKGLIALGPLGGIVAGLRGSPQALDGDTPLRHAIEPPTPVLPIRARRAQEERIGEVPPEWQILVAGIGHAIEEPVGVSVPERRSRIEPGHEPLNRACAHPRGAP